MGPSAQPLTSPKTPPVTVPASDPSASPDIPVLKPVLDDGQMFDLKQALSLGDLSTLPVLIGLNRFEDNNDLGFKGLQRKLRKLGDSLGKLEGEELHAATKEVEHLENIEKQLFLLSKLKIKDPTVDEMRRDCAAKLLADVNNPLGAGNYKAGVDLLGKLYRFAQSEKPMDEERERLRKAISAFYPGGLDSGYAFTLNTLDARDHETDPTRMPDWDVIENLPVAKAYRQFRDSDKEEDQRTARAVESLFFYLRDESAFKGGLELNPGADTLGALMDDRYKALTNPDLKPFFARVQELRDGSAQSTSDGAISKEVADSLQGFGRFATLTPKLYQFDVITSKFPPDKVRDALLADCRDMAKLGPDLVLYLRDKGHTELADTLEDRLQEDVLPQESVLMGLKDGDLNALNLTNVAGSLGQVSSLFRTAEELKLKDYLTLKLNRLDGPLKVGDLQTRLDGITEEAMEDPVERFKAYGEIVTAVNKRCIVFVVEGRVKQLKEMKKPAKGFFDDIFSLGAIAAPECALAGGAKAYSQVVVEPIYNKYDEMAKAYGRAAELIQSEKPEEVLQGQHEFQRLEAAMGASGFNELKEMTKDLAEADHTLMTALIGLNMLGVAEVIPFLSLGARGLTALLPLELGTQRLLATGLTYVGAGLAFTGVQREMTGIFMPDADQGNFFQQWVLNTAMMGAGSIGAKAGAGAFEKGLEWLAARRIAARMGTEIVVAGSSTGTAIEASVLNAEKDVILQSLTARFSQTATVFGTEYTAVQVFEYVKTVGTLAANDVQDPEKAAFDHVFSLKSQGMLAGFMVVMKAHGMTSMAESDPMITDAAMKIEYQAITRSLNRELPKFQSDMEAAGIQEPKDLLAHPELLQKAKTLLSLQTDMLAFKAKLNPTDTAVIDQLTATVRLRDTADPVFKFMDGMETVFGESNAFGVRPLGENSGEVTTSYTYQKGHQGKIVSKLRNVPGVDAANIQISPNGYIEVPFLVPEAMTIRLVPAANP